MEPEPHKKPIRFYEIDLLRFLAAFAVVLNHYTWRASVGPYLLSPVSYPEFAPYTKYGLLGVQLFFIISGYVVLMSAWGKTIKQFFLSRVTRLYPAFWAACTLTFLVVRLFGPHKGSPFWGPDFDLSLRTYLVNLTMLQEFLSTANIDGVFWSLTVEIGFYFLISLVIGYKLFNHLPLLCLLWLLGAAAVGPYGGTPLAFLFITVYSPYFVAGMAFYLLQNRLARAWQLYGLLAFSYVLALRQAVAYGISTGTALHDPFSGRVMMVWVTVFYVVFYLVITRRINLQRFTWLSNLGAMTYPLYLVHAAIGYVIYQRIGNQVNKYALLGGLILTMLVVAYLIHIVIEKRLSKPLGKNVNQALMYLEQANSTKELHAQN